MSDLYRMQLLEHYRHPNHWGILAAPDLRAELDNPTCGDRLAVGIRLAADGQTITDVAFTGEGCALAIAGASMLGDLIIGQKLSVAAALPKEKLLVEMGIDPGPTRLKCAILALAVTKQAMLLTE